MGQFVNGQYMYSLTMLAGSFVTLLMQERQQLLAQAANTGVITDYAGWRQGLKGKVFKIKGTLSSKSEPNHQAYRSYRTS